MTEDSILTVIHCDRCGNNMLIAFPGSDPDEEELAILRGGIAGEAWAVAELDQIKASMLAAHQAGETPAPCR